MLLKNKALILQPKDSGVTESLNVKWVRTPPEPQKTL